MALTITVPCSAERCELTARWAMGPFTVDGEAVGPATYECPEHHFTKLEAV